MKISKNLQLRIYRILSEAVNEHLQVIDEEYCTDRIMHESWKTIHKSACHLSAYLPSSVTTALDHYRRSVEPVESWRPMSTAPKDGTYVLLSGPSGYFVPSLRVEVCRYDAVCRPLNPWVNHSNDAFTDGGAPPTGWLPLPGTQ